MALSKALTDKYIEAIVRHFIKNDYKFSYHNVRLAIRDLVYFREFYDSIEECLENLYPRIAGQDGKKKA